MLINGDDGPNNIFGTVDDDLIYGKGGDDAIKGAGGADFIFGNEGNDSLNGGPGNDTINGGPGNDVLKGNDDFNGSDGDDTLKGGGGADSLDGGPGYDTASYAGSGAGVNVQLDATRGYGFWSDAQGDTLINIEALVGSTYRDGLYGNGGANGLFGIEGDDLLAGRGGADHLDGGFGFDQAGYFESPAAVTVNLLAGTGSGGDAEGDTLVSIETIFGSVYADNLTGNDSDNGLLGQGGDDVLDGGAGADRLSGEAGSDRMSGGGGNDYYVVDSAGDLVVEAADAGTDIVQAGVSYALADNVETLTLEGTGNLNGTGNALVNGITGTEGNNLLDGRGGADRLYGGQGNDTYIVDDPHDMVGEYADRGTDAVRASVSFTLGPEVETLLLTGSSAINGTGNASANTIIGTTGNNVLDGRGGADSLRGGLGNDTYVVDDSRDQAIESAGQGTDLVNSSTTFTLGVNVETLTLTGSGAVAGTGNTLANTITGNGAANPLAGLAGRDTLTGGAGADTFVFKALADSTVATSGRDLIEDFSRAQHDRIDLHLIDANTGLAGNQGFSFIGAVGFHRKAGELQAVASGADTLVSGDVNGDGRADFAILLDGRITLQSGDFLL